jgi:peptidoglycan hydrolase-like protein with peptidoglycan-binding domain
MVETLNQKIANHYLAKIITAPEYNSPNPGKRLELLYRDFNNKLEELTALFYHKVKNQALFFVEGYRSNALQYQHYLNGASQIKKNGMHHYGIAIDIAFKINGAFTYNGDYKILRRCFDEVGLYKLGEWDKGHVQFIPATTTAQNALRQAVDKAVRDFQRVNKLVVDGIVGTKTIAKAKAAYL